MKKYLYDFDDTLRIVSSYVIDIESDNQEAMVNEINDIVPHVIFSKLETFFNVMPLIQANIQVNLHDKMYTNTHTHTVQVLVCPCLQCCERHSDGDSDLPLLSTEGRGFDSWSAKAAQGKPIV